ncbi:hypothetical protein NWP13_22295 [Rhodococcus pyridinivorans]|nr:hypothetical protein [Rhodococcus pyridinivorans]
MATSTQRSSSTVAAAAAARLHSVLHLAVLGLAAFGLGVAGLVARSFPASWSGVAVSVVFVVLGVVAALPVFGPPLGRWRSGYTAVAAVFAVATPWMAAAVQFAGVLALLGVGVVVIGLCEHLPVVRYAGLAAFVVGVVTSSDFARGWLPLAETGTYDLVPALVTAIVGVGAAVVGVWLWVQNRRDAGKPVSPEFR